MKILLDECLPVDFRFHLLGHEVHSAEWAGLKSRKNGELLSLAEAAGYDVLLSVDQALPYQNNFTGRTIAVLGVRARTNQIEDLVPLVEAILEALKVLLPGTIARVG